MHFLRLMSFLRPIQWYHSHADPIWPDGTFKNPNFQGPGNTLLETQVVTCAWNQSWSPPVLPSCVATSCPQIPFPPASSNLVYKPDAKNNMTLKSGEKIEPCTLCLEPVPTVVNVSSGLLAKSIFFYIDIGIFVVL